MSPVLQYRETNATSICMNAAQCILCIMITTMTTQLLIQHWNMINYRCTAITHLPSRRWSYEKTWQWNLSRDGSLLSVESWSNGLHVVRGLRLQWCWRHLRGQQHHFFIWPFLDEHCSRLRTSGDNWIKLIFFLADWACLLSLSVTVSKQLKELKAETLASENYRPHHLLFHHGTPAKIPHPTWHDIRHFRDSRTQYRKYYTKHNRIKMNHYTDINKLLWHHR